MPLKYIAKSKLMCHSEVNLKVLGSIICVKLRTGPHIQYMQPMLQASKTEFKGR